jgi:hypothetical protein
MVLEVLISAVRLEKETKDIQIGKEKDKKIGHLYLQKA